MRVYTYIYIYIYTHMHIHIPIHIPIHKYIYIYIYTHSVLLSVTAALLPEIPEVSVESLEESQISRWSQEVLIKMLSLFLPNLRPWNLKYNSYEYENGCINEAPPGTQGRQPGKPEAGTLLSMTRQESQQTDEPSCHMT